MEGVSSPAAGSWKSRLTVSTNLVPVETASEREAARVLLVEYLRWVGEIARASYGLSFDIEAMARSDIEDRAKFFPPTGRFYLVRHDGRDIGVGCLKRLAPNVGEIQRMYIQPHVRGVGAGRALVERLLQEARGLGSAKVGLAAAAGRKGPWFRQGAAREPARARPRARLVSLGRLRGGRAVRRQQHGRLPGPGHARGLPQVRHLHGAIALISVAVAQGVYYVVSGAWPLVYIDSFQKVTGRNTDLWLVHTVGLLVLIELVYVLKRVISPIYLADAVVELGFIGGWVASLA